MLSTRKRKDVTLSNIKVQVAVFAFDCLYLNGRSLLQAPLTERRQALYSALKVREEESAPGVRSWGFGGPAHACADRSRNADTSSQTASQEKEGELQFAVAKTSNDVEELQVRPRGPQRHRAVGPSGGRPQLMRGCARTMVVPPAGDGNLVCASVCARVCAAARSSS